jgi:hypothetical protein
MSFNLFILGSPNSEDGMLSPTSTNRAAKAIELQTAHPESVLLATGGFGSHFNTSSVPHRELLHQYLLQQGAVIDPGASNDLLSSNTVEDAIMILKFSASQGSERCGIVTSKFHIARCRYIFECLARLDFVQFFVADDPPSLNPEIFRHEAAALSLLQAQGGVLIDSVLHPNVQPS